MGDTRCAAGCKMGLLPDGEECGACGGTGVARHGMPDSQPKVDWLTRTEYRAVCEQQVSARNLVEAMQIAKESVEDRSFTSEVTILRCVAMPWAGVEDYAPLREP